MASGPWWLGQRVFSRFDFRYGRRLVRGDGWSDSVQERPAAGSSTASMRVRRRRLPSAATVNAGRTVMLKVRDIPDAERPSRLHTLGRAALSGYRLSCAVGHHGFTGRVS